jgi:acetoin utilization deacetylase AcuC-like enzyme
VAVLFSTHPAYAEHQPGHGHPERPERLEAVMAGVERSQLDSALVPVSPRPATREELLRVHPATLVDALERFIADGGGSIDGDTSVSPGSWDAALLAAGSGLDLVERLERGEGEAGFCAVRPPGHHATPTRAMGFCLFNNVAVTAAALADRGERVLIVDYDAHHGNGTQDVFWKDERVAYVSMHEWPLYPGTGALSEAGDGDGAGWTVNLALPSGTTGDVYRKAVADVVAPLAEEHGSTWLLISAGFDAHRADPLTGLGLSAGDYADVTLDLLQLAPPGRRLAFLEGGYDLDALADCTAACLVALAGDRHAPELPTAGGPGGHVPAAANLVHHEAIDAREG